MSTPIPDAALDDRIAFVGTSGSGKTFAAKGRVERLLALGHRAVVVDPLDVWWGLRLKTDGATRGFDVAILGGAHGDMPLNENAGAVIGEAVARSSQSCVIALRSLKTSGARQRFMLAFLDAIYESTDPNSGEPYHVVFDEADLWAPQKPMGNEMMLCHLMEEIVRRGRVAGFIPWLISQRPAVLNKNVLSQAEGVVAFNLTASQDRDAVGNWIEGQADRAEGKAILASLPTLDTGEAQVWFPRRKILTRAKFPANGTFDSSRTPKRGERRRETKLKPLDLGALQQKLGEVEAKIRANDPAALKAEIRRLTAELAARPGTSAPVDTAALEDAARAEGLGMGVRTTRAKADETLRAAVARARELATDLNELADDLVTGATELDEMVTRLPTAERPAAQPRPAGRAVPAVDSLRTYREPPHRPPVQALKALAGDGDNGFPRAEQSILNSLGQWRAWNHPTPNNSQVAWLAGYSPTSSSYSNARSALKIAGLVSYPGSDRVELTPAGLKVFRVTDTPDLVGTIRAKLPRAENSILEVLLRAFPKAMSNDKLAEAAGYSPTSSSYTNARSSLKTKELATYPSSGEVRASDWLFQR